MNKLFYPKLAAGNIKKNGKTYVPYVLTCIFTVAMYYIMKSLSLNEGLKNIRGTDTVTYIMELGCYVVALFALIFLFYTNSFLMKRRKREFGLYNILGMEKRHISKVIAFESLYITILSFAGGFIAGIALDRLMYLAVLKAVGVETVFEFYISSEAIITTIILFLVIFTLIFFNSLRQIHLSKPIELLNSKSAGEKEPKAKWITAIIGLLCIAGGYYISITTKDVASAILLFFFAVILVIIGTYLVFTAGSVAFLKLLRKNKKYYYKTNHFISVSGLIYRMKQNAVGLANICVLSTMVLVMVSSTTSLMIGSNDAVLNQYPHDISLTVYEALGDSDFEATAHKMEKEISDDIIENAIEESSLEITKKDAYFDLGFSGAMIGNTLETDVNISDMNNVALVYFYTLSDYNTLTNSNRSLNDGEVLMCTSAGVDFEYDTMNVFDRQYKIKERIDNFKGSYAMYDSYYLIVKDFSELEHIYEQECLVYDVVSKITYNVGIDFTGSDDEKRAVKELVDNVLAKRAETVKESDNDPTFSVRQRVDGYDNMKTIASSFFFLGLFLGVLFLMATILIIYYKQISEGYEDKERYEIMLKVGVSQKEIKKSIRSQILTVFFMPLIVAGIHTAAAFPIIARLLSAFSITNTMLMVICTLCCYLVFAVVYVIIYLITSRAYYKIVSK